MGALELPKTVEGKVFQGVRKSMSGKGGANSLEWNKRNGKGVGWS